MHPASWGPAEWTAAAALGTFAVALIASGLTVWQVFSAKALYREQARPFVYVDYAFDSFIISIAVKNTGSIPARDVSISFDPPLRAPGGDEHQPADAPMFAKGIPMLAPGREMRIFLGGVPGIFSAGEAGEIPMAYEVTLRYADLKGRRYEDPPLFLDLKSYDETEIERRPVVDALGKIETAIKNQRRAPAGRPGPHQQLRQADGQ